MFEVFPVMFEVFCQTFEVGGSNVWSILPNVWSILRNVWSILQNVWSILAIISKRVWRIFYKCMIYRYIKSWGVLASISRKVILQIGRYALRIKCEIIRKLEFLVFLSDFEASNMDFFCWLRLLLLQNINNMVFILCECCKKIRSINISTWNTVFSMLIPVAKKGELFYIHVCIC